MHLRRLEVHGFKAFAERQTFEFGPGMTVVMGPNGSGKSNVHDAIRWALGEHASRSIRARKTEDVIFSGSDSRRQMGTAEVTITLDNSEGWMPIDFNEVTVTRRAHRSGDNEYLINGQKVRLSDVLDLFRQAHVGQNSYAMMSQGLVDEVLAMRPVDRRGLIEEAADVKGHRHQLQLSERRLTETRDNLGRVRLLIREVEPRLRQLERQSKKAARYHEIQRQLHDALQTYYEQELRTANETLVAARATHDQQTQAFAAAQTEIAGHDEGVSGFEVTVRERTEALAALQTKERGLAEEGLRLEQQIALAEQRLELLKRRIADIEAELAASAELGAPTIEEDSERLAALELAVEQARAALEREREAMQAADAAARDVLREIAEAEARRTRLEVERTDAARRIEEWERRRVEAGAAREGAEERRDELLGELRVLGGDALELDRRGAALAAGAEDARQNRDATENAAEQQLTALTEARDAVRAAETQVVQLRERGELLAALAEQQPEAGASGEQALIAAAREAADGGEPLAGVIGAVGRIISVPDGLEPAVEAALADQFVAIIVEREEDAIAAIEFLRDTGAGTATVLPLDTLDHKYPLNFFNERGVVGVAARLVKTEQRYRPLIDSLLGRTIIVDDLDVARRMIKRGLGSVVTRDGTLLRPGGAYYGGRVGSGGSAARSGFALQSEIDAIPQRVAEAERAVSAATQHQDAAEQAVVEGRAVVVRARSGVDETIELAREHAHRVADLRRGQTALSAEMAGIRATLAVATDESGGDAPREARIEATRGIEAVGRALDAMRDRSEAVVRERDQAAERVTAAATTLAASQGTQQAALEERQQQTEAARRAQERAESLRAEQQKARGEIEDLELSLRGHREQAANNRSALALAQETIGPAHAALAEATEAQRDLVSKRGEVQARLMATERATLQADNDLREAATHLETLQRQVTDEGMKLADDGTVRPIEPAKTATDDAEGAEAATAGATGDTVDEDSEASDGDDADGEGPDTAEAPAVVEATAETLASFAPMRGGAVVDPIALRDTISELRGEVRALGSVNIEAVEDLTEERERHDYLSEQVQDLEAAEIELRAAIRDLRRLIRERFSETFVDVNEAFGEYFQRFFGGGTASLSLVQSDDDDDEDTDPGVEITAQPPGKRIASLNVLSGGERALTSVALLFALLSVNPAPVCVLDEVDAALDEANVGRFVETLRELCENSQFIVVSHNRRTFEAADSIYGISMGEDSVSRVLSLQLADPPNAS